MQVINIKKLHDYCFDHADAREAVSSWLEEAKRAVWRTPQDIKDRYQHASILEGNRVIFNIKGNDHRLEVRVKYKNGIVFIEWIGTHAEYDKRNHKRG